MKKVIMRRLSSYCICVQSFHKFSVHGGRFWRDVLDHFPLKFQLDFGLNIKKCLINNVDLWIVITIIMHGFGTFSTAIFVTKRRSCTIEMSFYGNSSWGCDVYWAGSDAVFVKVAKIQNLTPGSVISSQFIDSAFILSLLISVSHPLVSQ